MLPVATCGRLKPVAHNSLFNRMACVVDVVILSGKEVDLNANRRKKQAYAAALKEQMEEAKKKRLALCDTKQHN